MSELSSPPDAAPVLDQEFRVDEGCRLDLNVPGARARLRPAPHPDHVSIELTVAGAPEVGDEAVLDQVGLQTRQVKNTIQVTSPVQDDDPGWWRWHRHSAAVLFLDVRVPAPAEVSARIPGGTLVASGLEGTFNLSVPGGAVQLQDLTGAISLRARGSEVTLARLAGPQLSVQASSAPVSLTEIESEDIEVNAMAAPLTLQRVRGACTLEGHAAPMTLSDLSGPCQATVYRGDLSFEGALQANTALTAIGGALEVGLPPSTGASFQATGQRVTVAEALSFKGDRSASRVTGTLNRGGPSLTLRAVRGPIRCSAA